MVSAPAQVFSSSSVGAASRLWRHGRSFEADVGLAAEWTEEELQERERAGYDTEPYRRRQWSTNGKGQSKESYVYEVECCQAQILQLDNEEPPQAAGPPALGFTDEEDTLLHRVWLAWCQAVWVRTSEWEEMSETSSST